MKILLTGGVTGGHFYPIIAVAEEINNIARENRLVLPRLYFMSTDSYNEDLLFQNNISFIRTSAGKIRKSPGVINKILNFFDLFSTFFGAIGAIWRIFFIYPDVIFGKGGYASFPALFAAKILHIPVVIHESDSAPGKVNKWAGKFAKRIAISYPEAINFFLKKNEENKKVAYTGNPVRKEIQEVSSIGAREFFGFDPSVPTIFVTGGSQGSRFINEVILRALPELIKKYQIVHQTGVNNIKVVEESRDVILTSGEAKLRYRPIPYMNVLTLRMAAGASEVVISRAGSTIFEIALWGKPAIIIPIPEPLSHDQRSNAYAYARSGAASVIEERNLVGGVLLAEIEHILENPEEKQKMVESAKSFARKDAARLIANEIMAIAMEHEQ